MADIEFNPVVANMAGSATTAIFEKANALKAQGKDIISYAVGEPDYGPPSAVTEAVANAMKLGHIRYTGVAGTSSLKKAVVGHLRHNFHLEYTEQQFMVSGGAKQSLSNALTVMLRPGDEVVIPTPYWVSYPEMVKLNRGVPIPVRTKSSNGFLLTPEELEAAITPKTRLLILCNPSNPTGAIICKEALEALAAVLRKHPHVYVISDDIYNGVVLDGPTFTTAFATIDGMASRSIVINGMSKAYAMTGFRIGFLAAPLAIAKACAKLQSQTTSCPCSISQFAAEKALQDTGESYFTGNIADLRAKRDVVMAALNTIPGVVCAVPTGAFYAFPDVSKFFGMKTKEGVVVSDSLVMCSELLSYGIALVPGAAFGEPLGIRIAYATDMEKVVEGMERVKSFFSSLSPV